MRLFTSESALFLLALLGLGFLMYVYTGRGRSPRPNAGRYSSGSSTENGSYRRSGGSREESSDHSSDDSREHSDGGSSDGEEPEESEGAHEASIDPDLEQFLSRIEAVIEESKHLREERANKIQELHEAKKHLRKPAARIIDNREILELVYRFRNIPMGPESSLSDVHIRVEELVSESEHFEDFSDLRSFDPEGAGEVSQNLDTALHRYAKLVSQTEAGGQELVKEVEKLNNELLHMDEVLETWNSVD